MILGNFGSPFFFFDLKGGRSVYWQFEINETCGCFVNVKAETLDEAYNAIESYLCEPGNLEKIGKRLERGYKGMEWHPVLFTDEETKAPPEIYAEEVKQ